MYNRKDRFYKKAKNEGYKSRAAFKLKEINTKHKLIFRGSVVLDVGAAPGGWSQVLAELVGKSGNIVGVDIIDMEITNIDNFIFIKGDILQESTIEQIRCTCEQYDSIVSDAAPNTSGQKFADHAKSLEIVNNVFTVSRRLLKSNGNFLAKLFDGEDTKTFVDNLKRYFNNVSIYRPASTRKNSFEIYLICKGFANV